MANLDIKGSQSQRAGYNLKDAIEKDFFTYVGNDASAGTALAATITSATVMSQISELARMLYEQNVQDNNMFMVIPPWLMLKLKMAGVAFSINEGTNGTGGMFWTKDPWASTFVTNTLYNSGTQAAPVSTIIAGSYQSIGFAERMLATRSIELSGSRATQLDGGRFMAIK